MTMIYLKKKTFKFKSWFKHSGVTLVGVGLCLSSVSALDLQNLKSLAEKGDANAQLKLGIYYDEQGKNPIEAFKWIKKASDQGLVRAKALLGIKYTLGDGVSKDYRLAYRYTTAAAAQNDPVGYNTLGVMHEYGYGIEKNIQKAKHYYMLSANKGFSGGYYNLGLYYFLSKDPSINNDKLGINYIAKAAMLGLGEAQWRLGSINQAGQGVPINFILSYMWYQIAIINGDNKAKNNYFETHKTQGMKEAPYCYAFGQNNVALMYLQGKDGLEKSDAKAFDWMQKAYSSYPDAAPVEYNLARMYQLGKGTTTDYSKALDLLQQAAQKPYGPAQQYLGHLYTSGNMVKQDMVKAYAYTKLAEYTFAHPAKKYFQKYNQYCQPSLSTQNENIDSARSELASLKSKLSEKEYQTAMRLFSQLKAKQPV